MTHAGPWRVSARLFKSYWGGVITLPEDFAEKYAGGRRLALGFGGYYSICGSASRGPALGAIARPDPTKPTLDLLEMLVHPAGHPAERDGEYFTSAGGWWADQPTGRARGLWTRHDWCYAGTFVHIPKAHA